MFALARHKKKSAFRWVWRAVLGFVVLSMALGIVEQIRNPPKPRPAAPQKKDAPPTEEELAGRDIMAKAYIVGRTMARSGAIKPNAAQMDALSRAAQAQAGDTHTRGWFKQYFEAGFWEGWKAR
jgi:hypothetical protein